MALDRAYNYMLSMGYSRFCQTLSGFVMAASGDMDSAGLIGEEQQLLIAATVVAILAPLSICQ